MKLLVRGWEAALDFLYPPLCVLCRERLSREERVVCSRCWARVERWEGEVPRDGTRLVSPVYAACIYKATEQGMQDDHEPMQGIVHNLKYRNKRSLAKRLGKIMAEAVDTLSLPEAIIPVPLHSARKRERGYNQSDLLAREIGQRLEVPVLERALKRIKNTKSQTGLRREKRLENVKGAFRVRDAGAIRGRTVLLVDDVTTTGATLEACGEALALAGSIKICAVVAAWAQ
jgi:competence protein ComFC